MADAAAAIVKQLFDCVNTKDLDGFRELLHPDYTYQGPDGVVMPGVDAGVGVVATFTNAFPDLTLTLDHQYVDGDVTIVEMHATGTHEAELQGISPTGKSIDVKVVDIIALKDGKVLGEREYYDQMGMMQQLGVIPS